MLEYEKFLLEKRENEIYNKKNISKKKALKKPQPLKLFITGHAGCGKSVTAIAILDILKNWAKSAGPTGRAAVNVHGSTIHRLLSISGKKRNTKII